MKKYKNLICEADGDILTVRLNRPQARNALNPELMQDLRDFARDYRANSQFHTIILTGAADYFSAGADLGDTKPPENTLEKREFVRLGPDMVTAWHEIDAVTICAIEGYCIGGGAALAVACDFRIMGEESYMRLPEVPLGINMSWQSIPLITALIGPARAKYFTILGEAANAETCLEWGMADRLVGKGESAAEAIKWAEKISALPPLPVRMSKESINAAAHALAKATSYMDRDQYLLSAGSEDFKEGIRAFFQKRPPEFKGE